MSLQLFSRSLRLRGFSFGVLSFALLVTPSLVKAAPVVRCALNSYSCFLKSVAKKQAVTMTVTQTMANVQTTKTLTFTPLPNGKYALSVLTTQEKYLGKFPAKPTKDQLAAKVKIQASVSAMKGYQETFSFTDLTKFTNVLKNWQKGKFSSSLVADTRGDSLPVGDLYDFSTFTNNKTPAITTDASVLGRVIVKTTGTVPRGGSLDLQAMCPTGKVALAGGFTTDWDPRVNFPGSGTTDPNVWFKISDQNLDPIGPRIETDGPTFDGKGWDVNFENVSPNALGPLQVTTQVVCGTNVASLAHIEGPGIPMNSSLAASQECPVASLPIAGAYRSLFGVPTSFYPDSVNWQTYAINRDSTSGTVFPGAMCAAAIPVEKFAGSTLKDALLWQVVTSPDVTVSTQKVGTAYANCPAGTVAIGGGYTFVQNDPSSKDVKLKEGTLVSSGPIANGWSVSMYDNWFPFSGPVDGTLKTYAVCVNKPAAKAVFAVYPPLPISLVLNPSTGSINGTPFLPLKRTGFTVVFPKPTTMTVVTSTMPTAPVSSGCILQKLSINTQATTTISVGDTVKLSLVGSCADGSGKDITDQATFLLSDTASGSLSKNIFIPAKSGDINLSASFFDQGRSLSTRGTITVNGAKSTQTTSTHVLQSVSVTSLSPNTLTTSQHAILKANATYSDGKTADVTLVCHWSTTDPNIAVVMNQNVLQTLSGTGQVSAVCSYAEAGVSVTGSLPFSVQLDPSLQPQSSKAPSQ